VKAVLVLCCALLAQSAGAETAMKLASPHYRLDPATIREGATLFATYCLGCHSMKQIRYGRLMDDLGMSKGELEKDLMQGSGAALTRGIVSAMKPGDAKAAFGVAPPDLSLEARYRGPDWIYTYLRSFYQDPSRPSGWNNHLFPNVAMPNVLAGIGGTHDAQGRLLTPGSLPPAEFDRQLAQLTAWLDYASDPSVLERRAIAPYALGFLGAFTVLAWLTKRAYWRDVM
jgi:ubiquinol-cytochrome c reductase cytochrome c1 subunit